MRFKKPLTLQAGRTSRPLSHHNEYKAKLRDRWTFLNDNNCPPELRALVGERIARFHEYSTTYTQLRDCKDITELSTLCAKLIDAYQNNILATFELDYYAANKRIYGKHPYLRHYQQLTTLRSCSTKELVREQQKVTNNIWRVNSEIKKNNKPHLLESRQQKLREYQLRLTEINRLLGE